MRQFRTEGGVMDETNPFVRILLDAQRLREQRRIIRDAELLARTAEKVKRARYLRSLDADHKARRTA